MKQKEKRNVKSYLLLVVGSFFILLGIGTTIFRLYSNRKIKVNEEKKIDLFLEEQKSITEETFFSEDIPITEQPRKEKVNYIAVLEIPKISLRKGLVDKNSKDNNIDKNIYILKESLFPNSKKNSHIILASHSGNSENSYFKNLKKLKVGNLVYLHYNGKTYEYLVSKIYKIDKTGTMTREVYEKDSITLVTCIGTTDKQLVVVATLKR